MPKPFRFHSFHTPSPQCSSQPQHSLGPELAGLVVAWRKVARRTGDTVCSKDISQLSDATRWALDAEAAGGGAWSGGQC